MMMHVPINPTPNSQLPTPNSQLPTPNSQLPTPNILPLLYRHPHTGRSLTLPAGISPPLILPSIVLPPSFCPHRFATHSFVAGIAGAKSEAAA